MRMLVTSVDAEGCSCVVTETDLGAIAGEAKRAVVHKTTAAPPPSLPPPGHSADRGELGVGPGPIRMSVVLWPPGQEAELHHTHTVDYDVVLER